MQAAQSNRNELSKMIGENAIEVCNVFTSLLNKEGADHLKMYQTYLPGNPPPTDAAGYLLAIGRRLDLRVEVGGYGGGKFSMALTG